MNSSLVSNDCRRALVSKNGIHIDEFSVIRKVLEFEWDAVFAGHWCPIDVKGLTNKANFEGNLRKLVTIRVTNATCRRNNENVKKRNILRKIYMFAPLC